MGKSKKANDELRVEVVVGVRNLPGVQLNGNFLRECVQHWVDLGYPPDGVEIEAVHWERNGNRKTASSADDLETVRMNMLRRFLHSVNWTASAKVGTAKRSRTG